MTNYRPTVNVTGGQLQIQKLHVPVWGTYSSNQHLNILSAREQLCIHSVIIVLNLKSPRCNCLIHLTPSFIKIQSAGTEISHMTHEQSAWCHPLGNNLILKCHHSVRYLQHSSIHPSFISALSAVSEWMDGWNPKLVVRINPQYDYQRVFHFSK